MFDKKLDPVVVERFILDGFSHTLRDVCEQFVANDQQERQIDKIIQRLRKSGKIALTRKGRRQFWTATKSAAAA